MAQETMTPAAAREGLPTSSSAAEPSSGDRTIAQIVRVVAWTEGISLLLLFFVAMPVKYVLDQPVLVKVVGPIHGMLFLLYIAAIVMWRHILNWSWGKVFVAAVVASLPFATFLRRFHAPDPPRN